MEKIKILAISGSLRSISSNTAILQAATIIAPENIEIILYSQLGNLPHFNPDLDREPFPELIIELRRQIEECDGLLISCPEYAHGIPGTFKNALDWLVSSVEFPGKFVALFNTSPRATLALASLREILTVMSAEIIEQASLTVSLAGKKLNPQEIASDPDISSAISRSLAEFTSAIVELKKL